MCVLDAGLALRRVRLLLLPLVLVGVLAEAPGVAHGQQRAEPIQQIAPLEVSAVVSEIPRLAVSADRERNRGWTATGMAGGVVLLAPFDLEIANSFRSLEERGGSLEMGADFFRFVGFPGTVAVVGTLFGVGEITGRDHLSSMGMHAAQAIVAAEFVTYSGKVLLGRMRPLASEHDPYDFSFLRGLQDGDFRSFPSGHTTAAFAVASVLSSEIGERHPRSRRWVRPALYATATLAGASRLYHDEHWASDVAGGALVGTVAGWATTEFHRRRRP